MIPIDTEVSLKTSMSDNTLLYSWGSAAFGKLGTGIANPKDCETHSEFVRYDLGRSFQKYGDIKENHYYTYSPQPVVSFLGTKMRQVVAGK